MEKTLKEQAEVAKAESDDIQYQSVHLYDISTGFNVDYEACQINNKKRMMSSVISPTSK